MGYSRKLFIKNEWGVSFLKGGPFSLQNPTKLHHVAWVNSQQEEGVFTIPS